jgi:hypothetical protein
MNHGPSANFEKPFNWQHQWRVDRHDQGFHSWEQHRGPGKKSLMKIFNDLSNGNDHGNVYPSAKHDVERVASYGVS